MNDDIVTRLRALADEMDFGWRPPLLREAADALEETANSRSLHEQCAKELGLDKIDLLRERDALKAKLEEAEASLKKYREPYGYEGKRIDDERARAEKAESDLQALCEKDNAIISKLRERYDNATPDGPSPGSALLERVKKLEAVAEAARWFLVPSSECDETLSQLELNLAAALADLGEKYALGCSQRGRKSNIEEETRAVVVQQLKRLVETWCLTEGTIHAIEVVLADLDGKE